MGWARIRLDSHVQAQSLKIMTRQATTAGFNLFRKYCGAICSQAPNALDFSCHQR